MDVTCRLKVSWKKSCPSSRNAGFSEADLAPSGILQRFGGTTEIMKEIIGRGLGL